MAGTITTSASFAIVNGAYKESFAVGPKQTTQTAIGGGNPGTVTVTTSEGDLTLGLTTPGMCIIENLDDTNYVELGPKSGGAMILEQKIPAGEWIKMWIGAAVTLRAKANTASVQLRIRAYEV